MSSEGASAAVGALADAAAGAADGADAGGSDWLSTDATGAAVGGDAGGVSLEASALLATAGEDGGDWDAAASSRIG
jgi:hypothetical protein